MDVLCGARTGAATGVVVGPDHRSGAISCENGMNDPLFAIGLYLSPALALAVDVHTEWPQVIAQQAQYLSECLLAMSLLFITFALLISVLEHTAEGDRTVRMKLGQLS